MNGVQLSLLAQPLAEFHVGWLYCYVKEPAKFKSGDITPVCILLGYDSKDRPLINLIGVCWKMVADRDQLRPLVLKRKTDIIALERNFQIKKEQLELWQSKS